MHLSSYAASRLRLSILLAGGMSALRRRFHRLHRFAHTGESAFHVAYLGGVAFGGGYRYAAMGLLVCMALAWFCAEGD